MKVISFEDVKKLNLKMEDYYCWAKDVFKGKENSILPPKISMKKEGHIFINVMPSVIDDIGAHGVKIVSRFPKNTPTLDSQILLYNSENGNPLAILDGNFITAYRTGAVAALAINELAINNYESIGIIGLGNIAYATMNVLISTLNNRNIKVKLYKYKDQAEKFIKYYEKYDFINFEIVDTYEKLIVNSDVIVSCVTSTDINFGKDEWFKEGCLVVPVHTMGFQNCDLFFDKVIVDDMGHVECFKYFNKFKEKYELADVLKNSELGRKNNKERILAYNIGNSIFDIYFAKKIYDMLKDKNTIEIDLKPPIEKEWV